MLEELLKVQEEQRCIIKKQANIIDSMFVLLCNYVSMDEIEPLLNNVKEVAKREDT